MPQIKHYFLIRAKKKRKYNLNYGSTVGGCAGEVSLLYTMVLS